MNIFPWRICILGCVGIILLAGWATLSADDNQSADLAIVDKWSGDYPVEQLDELPEQWRHLRVGVLGDTTIFTTVWQAFKSDQPVPQVDFDLHMVVYSRNVDFYNRTAILKITLTDGAVEILAMETMSALPIEDKVAMAMAVISRAEVRFIQVGKERIPVSKGH